MPEFSAPFAGAGGKIVNEDQQRAYFAHLGDGIINAKTRDAGKLAADGTSVLRLNPVEVKLNGLYYALTGAPKAFNLATIGTQPAAGQTRIDALVWRLDRAAKTVTAEVVPGQPLSRPSLPPLARNLNTYEELAWSWTWSGVGMQNGGLRDLRSFIGGHRLLSDSAALPADADIGSTAIRAGVVWDKVNWDQWVARTRSRRGVYNDTVKANSIVTIVHDLGVIPSSVQLQKRATGNDEVDGITELLEVTSTTTQTQIVVRRSDPTGSPLRRGRPLDPGNPCHFYWEVSA